jgi:hypothetical protein
MLPSTSPGIKSGVNWMRPNFSDTGGERLCQQRFRGPERLRGARPPASRLVNRSSMTVLADDEESRRECRR